jgi:arylformamidase
MRKGKIVDLSRLCTPEKEPFKLNIKTFYVDEYIKGMERKKGDWYIVQDATMCSHIGTHIESPYHHVKGGKDISEISLNQVIGEAIVLDFTHKKAREPITLDEVKKYARSIKTGDIVLFHFGWSKYYNTEMHQRGPYLLPEVGEWLVERKVACVGSDSFDLDTPAETGEPIHRFLLGNNIPMIEELCNMENLTRNRVFFMALPLRIKQMDSSPIRAIAIEDLG